MRPHGRASIDSGNPSALGICDRCSFRFNLKDLNYQYEWAGPRLQNTQMLVCDGCLDKPQEQLRTIIIPADPEPVENPRPEATVQDNNPISPIGQNADPRLPYGTNIGTLISGGGTYAAFDSNTNKPFRVCACLGVSGSSYGNWVGKNWAQDPSGVTTPSGLTASTLSYTMASFVLTAPNDTAFLGSSYATTYRVQGSSDGTTWTTFYTSATDGSHGQEISVDSVSGSNYQYHRADFVGDGVHPISVAQFAISVSNEGQNA